MTVRNDMAERLSALPKLPAAWIHPPDHLKLGDGEVHVWSAGLKLPDSYLQALRRTLSGDEKARSERFHFQSDRDRFVATRGLLRIILSEYLLVSPHQLQFLYGSHGKPALEGGQVRFNASHSRDMALYAISRSGEVGVDIEHIKIRSLQEDIAERFFSPGEVRWLRALPEEQRPEAFCACWTRREACLKAKGDSLFLTTDNAITPLVYGPESPNPATIASPHGGARTWSLWQLAPGPGYMGALAVEGACRKLRCFQWPEKRAT